MTTFYDVIKNTRRYKTGFNHGGTPCTHAAHS